MERLVAGMVHTPCLVATLSSQKVSGMKSVLYAASRGVNLQRCTCCECYGRPLLFHPAVTFSESPLSEVHEVPNEHTG